jgi:ABC-type polysaccharide/polyol phosphate export permease
VTAVLELDDRPATRRGTVAEVVRHRKLLAALARTSFQVRYRRAVLGVLWVIAIPLLQAAVLAAILSRVARFGDMPNFAVYVLSGILPWAYLASSVGEASTAIVSGSSLADKIWFPRAVLPLVEPLAALAGLGISMVVLVVALPVLGEDLGLRLLLLVPACALLVAFVASTGLVLSALHVYFRDVRHLVSAGLLLWFYGTPIFYPPSLLGEARGLLDFNPATGIVSLFRLATIGSPDPWARAVIVSVATTVVLLFVALEIYRRHDRLFADRL